MSTQHTPSDNAATKFAASLIPLDNYDGELTDMDCRLLEQFGPAEMSRIIQALSRRSDELLEALEDLLDHHEELGGGISMAAQSARTAIAKAKGGAA